MDQPERAAPNFILRALARRRARIAPLAIVAGIAQASILAILNTAAESTGRGETALHEAFQFLCAALLFAAAQMAAMRATTEQVEQAVHEQRTALVESVRRAELGDFERIAEGDLLGPIWKEIQSVSQAAGYLTAAAQSAVLLAFCCVYIAWLSPLALLLVLGTVTLGILAYLARGRRMVARMRAVLAAENRLHGLLSDLLQGFRELKLSPRRGDALARELEEASEQIREQRKTYENIMARGFTSSQLTFYFITASIVFILPSLSSTFPEVVVKVTAATLFMTSPIGFLGSAVPVFISVRASLENIRALEERLHDIEAQASNVEEVEDFRRIGLEQVTFTHHDARGNALFKLGPLDFSLVKGEIVFVTGGNGSGKSTFVHLLCGLRKPETGTVRLDGLSVDREDWARYRTLFSVIFSDMHLFQRLYGLDAAALDRARIAEVLDLLEMRDKVGVEDGAFTTIDLSAGQRKRAAMLACVLERRPILVLDEWAADQDPHFRRKFYEVILPWLRQQGFTIVAVTHDDRYFHHADRRIHLREGRIVED